MTNVSASKEQQTTPSGTASTADGLGELEHFLLPRGLDPELAVRYGLSVSAGFIKISYRRNDETIYSKCRGIHKKTFHCEPVDQKPFLWNIDVLKDDTLEGEPLIVTEGELDALAAIQAGYPRIISVPNGAPAQRDTATLSYIDEVESLLRNLKEIIIAVDNDEAGLNLLHDLGLRLGRVRCKWVKYPENCKDLNDVLRLHGEEGIKKIISGAQWVETKTARKMSDLPPIPYSRAYDIGIGGFENHMKLRLGDFSVVTGIPSHGKSTFVNDVMCRMAMKYNFKIAFASFEQSPQTDHKRSLRTWHAQKLEKHMSDEEKVKADQWIDDRFLFITPNPDDRSDEPTLAWVLEIMAAAVIRDGVKIVVIDPWNEMTHHRPHGTTLTEYTGDAIRHLKRFAVKHMVHVMVVAHPAKPMRTSSGDYPIPSLYDISDSQHWFNKADLGIVVHRSPDKGDTVIIAKSRYHTEIGRPGVVDVKFSLETGRYTVVDNQVLHGG